MSLRNHMFEAAASLALCGFSSHLAAQQTTKDGVGLENAYNTLQRPYRQAGSSDPRDRGPMVARGFGRRDRRATGVGQGIPSAVEARLAGHTLASNKK